MKLLVNGVWHSDFQPLEGKEYKQVLFESLSLLMVLLGLKPNAIAITYMFLSPVPLLIAPF